jgi:gastrin-releasing peptide receptor
MSAGLVAYSIAVLSIQRYNVIVNPIQVRVSSHPKWRVTAASICGVWIAAALFAIPSALSKFQCFGSAMEIRNIAYYKRVLTFELFVFCVLSLFVIAFSYITAARYLVKSADIISEETQNPKLKARRNIAVFVLGLTAAFVISYVPLHAIVSYIYFNSDRNVYLVHLNGLDDKSFNVQLAQGFSLCLFLMDSSLNPVALCCTSLAFRKHFKRYLCCCCKANSPPTDIELARRNRV